MRGMRAPPLARLLLPRLPFYYGWVILGCVCLAGFARQGPAVAVLSIFVDPMRRDLGWSSTAFGGAVALGGVLAALVSPAIGRLLDRTGARLVLCYAVVSTALAMMALSLVDSLLLFYCLFCFGRMNWAGPFELGLYGALNNWFLARRALAASIATLAQLAGLVAFPLIAHFAMAGSDWRAGWVAVGLAVLGIGFLPVWLLLVRRPEDVGVAPEPAAVTTAATGPEPDFTRAEAMRTQAFWMLALFTVLVFPCQAGVSLYQASHMIERGIDPTTVATVVSAFSVMSALASFGVGWLPRTWPVRRVLAACSALLCIGAVINLGIATSWQAFLGAAVFGIGIGGMLTLLPVVWADYFGRKSYGAIRGAALSMQVLAQASGPIAAGALRDAYGDYTRSLMLFAVLAGLGAVAVLAARKPETAALAASRV
jgi:OFA family oxalate/formate antiporter-like MFS transporter